MAKKVGMDLQDTRNKEIRNLLNRIILDEKNHIQVFSKIIEESQKEIKR